MGIVYLTLALTLGIILEERAALPPIVPVFLVAWGLLGMGIYRREKIGRTIFALFLFFGLGILRLDLARPTRDEAHILQLNDSGSLLVEGVIIEEPTPTDRGLQITVSAKQAAGRAVHGHVLAQIPRYSDAAYGDKVRLFGRLRTPAEFDTFSYKEHLARQGVYSAMYNADVELLSTEGGNPFYRTLLSAKDQARQFIQNHLPEPHASLLVGILLGDESGLSEKTQDQFAATGAAHVIAISGFNMVILAGVLMGILSQLIPKHYAAWAGIVLIAVYTIFVGAGASVLRAAIMSSLLIIADALRRKTFVPASLAFAALLMSALDPWVLWDIGFQLSFAAVMGMAIFVPPFEARLKTTLERFLQTESSQRTVNLLTEPLLVTLAAQITTTPLIVHYFGNLSIVSLPVNFLIIPVQTPILIFGALGTSIGLVVPSIGNLLLQPAWIFLSWNVSVVETFAQLPIAQLELSLGEGAAFVFFGLLGGWMWFQATRPLWLENWLARSRLPARALAGLAIIVFIVLVSDAAEQTDGRLHVRFWNAGAGSGVLIQTPQGAHILVNGGEFPTQLLEVLGGALPPRTRNIDALFITAPQPQNIAALPEVAERFRIGVALTNGQPSDTSQYVALQAALEEDQTPVISVSRGYTLQTSDGVTVEVLHPTTPPAEEGMPFSETALVLRVTYGQAVFLLAGDIQAPIEEQLLQHPHQVQTTVLQASGSGQASSAAFVATANPQIAVLHPSLEPPSPTVLHRLREAQIFRADRTSSVEVISDGQGIQIITH